MRARILAFAVLSTLVVPAAARGQCPVGQGTGTHGVALQLRLTPGQTRRFVSTVDQRLEQTVMGQDQKTHQVLTTGVRYDVLKGSGGGGSVRVTYESVHVQVDNPMMHVDYDTSHPDSVVPQGAESFAAMVGHSVVVHLDPNGSVTSVAGVDSLLDAMVDAIQIPPGVSRADLLESLKQRFGAQAMKQMMQQAISALPDRPVAVGDSWTCTAQLEVPLPLTQVSKWTLRSRSNGVATMDVSIHTQSDSTVAVPAGMGSMSIRYAVTGDMKGSAQIDEKTGWVVRSSLEGDLSGNMKVQGSPAGDMVMPMTTHLKNTVEPAGG